MTPERMRERLKVERTGKVTSVTGAESTVRTTVYEHLSAERVKLTGRLSNEVGEHFPDYHAEFYVWIDATVKEHWLVTDLSTGILYEVTNVIPNRQADLKTLYCERVNE